MRRENDKNDEKFDQIECIDKEKSQSSSVSSLSEKIQIIGDCNGFSKNEIKENDDNDDDKDSEMDYETDEDIDYGVNEFYYIYDIELPKKPPIDWKLPKWVNDWVNSGMEFFL